jgi:DNA-binding Xre family transcriptional regulator
MRAPVPALTAAFGTEIRCSQDADGTREPYPYPESMNRDCSAVTASLKRVLKKKRLSYRELGARLRLSESGVKKMMTAPDLSLTRLVQICAAIGVEPLDLMEDAWRASPAPFSFSPAQEKFLVDNPACAACLLALIDEGFETAAVERRYQLDRTSMRLYLKQLEKHRFLERSEGGARSLLGPVEWMRSRLGNALTLPSLERAREAAPASRCLRTGRVRLTARHLDDLNEEILDLLLRYAVIARQDELYVADAQLIDTWVIAATARQQLSDVLSIPRRTR